MDLFGAQAFYIHETAKVVIVYEDKYFVFATFQIVISCLKNFDDNLKLAVVGLVSNFCRNHFP